MIYLEGLKSLRMARTVPHFDRNSSGEEYAFLMSIELLVLSYSKAKHNPVVIYNSKHLQMPP